MESHWETRTNAPFTILAWPDAKNERNFFEFLKVPSGLSLMSFHSAGAEVKGLKDFPPGERPPVWPVFLSFRFMVAFGLLFVLLSFLGWMKSRKDKLEASPFLLRLLVWAIPLPYVAIQMGWIVTEVGRQPWIVYGLMKTSDATSKAVGSSQVLISLIAFTLLYGTLGLVDILLLRKYAKRGPDLDPAPMIKTAKG
jgi:cytochrome d ubiquinol oxidase subunit I